MKSSFPHLILVAIASLFLLFLFTIVNCQKNYDDKQMEGTFLEKRSASNDRFYDFLKEEDKFNDENMDEFLRDSFKIHPNRRSTFHALRGKRRII